MSKESYFHIIPGSEVPQITLEISSFSPQEQWHYTDRAHPFWTFYWNKQPYAQLITAGNVLNMTEETCFLIPPYTLYSTNNQKRFDHFYCHFKVSGYFEHVRRRIYCFPSDLLKKEFPSFRKEDTETKRVFTLKHILARYLDMIGPEDFLSPGSSRLDPGIRTAVHLMDENIARPPGNRELARKAGMSLKTFYETFSRNLGMTPKRYLLNQRMELARKMLLHSSSTPEEIAERTGYADRFHFSKAFRNFYTLSPIAFRKKFSPEVPAGENN